MFIAGRKGDNSRVGCAVCIGLSGKGGFMKWLFVSFALMAGTSWTASAAFADNVQIPRNYLPKVQYYMAPLEYQITGEKPGVRDLRQEETEQKYVMHIGELPPLAPEQIRPSAQSPVVREWGLPEAGFQSHVGDASKIAGKSNLPPVGVHRVMPEVKHASASRPTEADLARTAKPLPIASVYQPYSQNMNCAVSSSRTSARGKLIHP